MTYKLIVEQRSDAQKLGCCITEALYLKSWSTVTGGFRPVLQQDSVFLRSGKQQSRCICLLLLEGLRLNKYCACGNDIVFCDAWAPHAARYNDDEDEDTDPRAYSRHNKDLWRYELAMSFTQAQSSGRMQKRDPQFWTLIPKSGIVWYNIVI